MNIWDWLLLGYAWLVAGAGWCILFFLFRLRYEPRDAYQPMAYEDAIAAARARSAGRAPPPAA